MTFLIKNLEELEKFTFEFLEKIKADKARATVIALSGDLGAGKTAFVKCAAKYFGIKESITSPTFVILKRFPILDLTDRETRSEFEDLVHIDAYRLEKGEELGRLRFQEFLNDPKNIIFIEWPEKVQSILPEGVTTLKFTFIDETTRQIEQ